MNYKKFFHSLLITSILVLFPIVELAAVNDKIPDFESEVYKWSKTYAESLHLIQHKYFENINPEKAIVNSLDALLQTLDPHSKFMDTKSFKEILESTQGEFCGIGVVIDNTKKDKDEALNLVDVIHTGPADKVGVRAGDKIVQINDEAIKDMAVEEIIAKLKGKRNTTVQIKVQRAGNRELLPFTISRDIVKEQNALCYYFKKHGIHYLALNLFTEKSAKQLESLLKQCLSNKSKGLILDLRNNSGGLLNSVVDISGLFLEKNSTVVVTKDRDRNIIETFNTTRPQPINIGEMPIFILTNNYTASAAEILAGVLQSYSNDFAKKSHGKNQELLVFLVGSTTFGKGSVQEVIPVSNDCAIKLTIALYYLPHDVSIQGVGIKPDFTIEQRFAPTNDMEWFTTFFGYEHTLKNSIKHEKNQDTKKKIEDKKEKTWQEKKQEQIGSDYIILSTMRLIEMLNMAKKAYPEKVRTRPDCIKFLNNTYSTQDKIVMEEIKC